MPHGDPSATGSCLHHAADLIEQLPRDGVERFDAPLGAAENDGPFDRRDQRRRELRRAKPLPALEREGQKKLVREVTEIVARISGDPSQAGRTRVLLTEAAEGGWGLAGTAFGREEFAALAARAQSANHGGSQENGGPCASSSPQRGCKS